MHFAFQLLPLPQQMSFEHAIFSKLVCSICTTVIWTTVKLYEQAQIFWYLMLLVKLFGSFNKICVSELFIDYFIYFLHKIKKCWKKFSGHIFLDTHILQMVPKHAWMQLCLQWFCCTVYNYFDGFSSLLVCIYPFLISLSLTDFLTKLFKVVVK